MFLNADKSYDVLIRIGEASTTGDLDGEITCDNFFTDIKNIDLKKIEKTQTRQKSLSVFKAGQF